MFGIPKESKLKEDRSKLIVEIIEDQDNNSMVKALGISKEREKELMSILERSWKSNEKISDILAGISLEMRHANELALVSFQAGCIRSAQDEQREMKSSGTGGTEIIKMKGSRKELDEILKLLEKLRKMGDSSQEDNE